MFLKDQDLVIRDFSKKDIENKVRWINDPENNLYLHYDLPLEYDKTLNWFLSKNNQNRCDCIIEYSDNPIGLIGLLNIDRTNLKAEFYICIGENEYKGRGFAKKSSSLLIEYGFNELGLNKIYLNVDSNNVSACRLYNSLGFNCEGEFKQELLHRGSFIDRKRYAILKNKR